jgi:hypothetical protein
MAAAPRHPGLRRPALLGAFLLYVFALLPMLGEAHQHQEESDHSACQLCLVHGQAYAAPAPPEAPASAAVLFLLVPGDAPRALQVLPLVHASRGPPSA